MEIHCGVSFCGIGTHLVCSAEQFDLCFPKYPSTGLGESFVAYGPLVPDQKTIHINLYARFFYLYFFYIYIIIIFQNCINNFKFSNIFFLFHVATNKFLKILILLYVEQA